MPKYGFQLCADYDKGKHPTNAIAEVKFDGMMVLAEHGRLYNRKTRDVTFQFPEVHVADGIVIVGELVIMRDGLSQFHLLQKRNVDNPSEIRLRSMLYPATLVAFDLLEINGQDLTDQRLEDRRKALEGFEHTKALNGSVHVAGYWGCPPDKVDCYLDFMRQQSAEGIVVKDLDARYRPVRNAAWMKLKCWKEEDYDILRHEITDNGGFVIWISNRGYEQKVVVNGRELMSKIAAGQVNRVTVGFLDVEASGALRQPHVRGVPWGKP